MASSTAPRQMRKKIMSESFQGPVSKRLSSCTMNFGHNEIFGSVLSKPKTRENGMNSHRNRITDASTRLSLPKEYAFFMKRNAM